MLRAVSEMDSSILFEYDMSCISRFVRLHTDKLCFAFMTKNAQNVETPYTCFVFLGYNEEVVPALFNLVRKCALLSSSSADMRLRFVLTMKLLVCACWPLFHYIGLDA